MRRDGKLVPASWEDALEEVRAPPEQTRDKSGADAIGFIGSNRTTNEENYLLGRIARAASGTNNIDHHRTADYAGLVAALGAASAAGCTATMAELYDASAVLLIGNDPTEQNPLVAWQIRSAIRHHGARLYVINSKPVKLQRQGALTVRGAARARSRARSAGSRAAKAICRTKSPHSLATLKEALEKASDVVILFGAALSGRGHCTIS